MNLNIIKYNQLSLINILVLIKIFFNLYTKIWFRTWIFKIKRNVLLKKKNILLKQKNIPQKKKIKLYSKRFYRRIFKIKYLKSIHTNKFKLFKLNYTNNWLLPINHNRGYKPLLHIKILFNLNEFLLYDFYNFHKTKLSKNITTKFKSYQMWTTRFFKKINFFFYIKDSINVFRTHTLQFFKTKFQTNKRVNIFFSGFSGFNTLMYIWFFEFSITYFLIKLHLSESVSQSLIYITNNLIFLNSKIINNRWALIHSGFILQLVVNLFIILRIKYLIIRLLKFFKFTKKFFKRTILRSKKYRIKIPNITSKGQYLVNSKAHHSRLWEVDYKSLSAIILPQTTLNLFLNTITLFWLNFWNYRLTLWKYSI